MSEVLSGQGWVVPNHEWVGLPVPCQYVLMWMIPWDLQGVVFPGAWIVAALWDSVWVCPGLGAICVADWVVAYIADICLWPPEWAGSTC